MSTPARLILETGEVFEGTAFGALKDTNGEVVFNTAHTGYQEILTDPSYSGQMVVMTYPLIGNYGTNDCDVESRKVWVNGFIVKEFSEHPSNQQSTKSLNDYLVENSITGLCGIDTRRLVRLLRTKGSLRGMISLSTESNVILVEKCQDVRDMNGLDLVQEVTANQPYEFNQITTDAFKVVAFDCGIKTNILRILERKNCHVTVVPAFTTAEDVLKMKPDGIFISNGPGDPSAVTYLINSIKKLTNLKFTQREIPMFGICLGHQLMGLAFGAKTYKLKFGHHGANHPVKNLLSGRVEITSQNHGFAIEEKTLPKHVKLTHRNLYDNTVEGFQHSKFPYYSVQYHPEAAPGPRDANYLFDEFIEQMKKRKS